MHEIPFDKLSGSDLYIDAIYKGGPQKNIGAEVLSRLLPNCENSGGFRKVYRKDDKTKLAYVVLYTSMQELEWPDYLDVETGIFRYYGDNRKAGHNIQDTKKKGNKLLDQVFAMLNNKEHYYQDIPPFLIFKKVAKQGRDVQFLGVAAPGNPHISPDKDLVAFWRASSEGRFQNYEAYFTILNTIDPIPQKWLNALINDHKNSLRFAPKVWRKFITKGRYGIEALRAQKMHIPPNKYDQLQSNDDGNKCLREIRAHYSDNAYGFEICAKTIVELMDSHFQDFSLTRPWRDGGRDAIGHYVIGGESKTKYPLKIDCAIEAKCYNENNSVGVREMSRLISRIRYRQFGILVTTSFVNNQAYREVLDDGHPILIISASDIATILKRNSINYENIGRWLRELDEKDQRFNTRTI